jgi:hypothetical protein
LIVSGDKKRGGCIELSLDFALTPPPSPVRMHWQKSTYYKVRRKTKRKERNGCAGLNSGGETREGWPLLTVETEVNGDSTRTNERGPSLVGSLGLSCWYKRLFVLPWPSTNQKIFRTIYYFNYFVPIAQKVGQAAVVGRLSQSVYLWIHPRGWGRGREGGGWDHVRRRKRWVSPD